MEEIHFGEETGSSGSQVSKGFAARKFRTSTNILKFCGLSAAARHLHGRHSTETSP